MALTKLWQEDKMADESAFDKLEIFVYLQTAMNEMGKANTAIEENVKKAHEKLESKKKNAV